MPYYIGGLVDEVDSLIARTPAQFQARGIDARILHEVERIDVGDRHVVVRSLQSGDIQHEPYDQLVIATGAAARYPDLPGIDAHGVHLMSSMNDMLTLERDLAVSTCQSAVIVGGGYIGLEMAEAFLLRGLEVTVIHSGPAVMPALDEDMGELINAEMESAGVRLVMNQRVTGFETTAGRVSSASTSTSAYPADVVILGLGTRPRSGLATAAGIPTGTTGGILVNDRMETSIPGIWAAGDCTEMRHLVSGKPVSISLGTIANKQGRICGINLGGGDAQFPGVLATAITRFNDLEIARTGLCEFELEELGTDYVAGRIESSTRSGYFPGSSKITVKLTGERTTGKILGGQIIGGPGAGKRIDTLVAAIGSGMTLRDLEYLDLSYAPPFSPVWDPVQIAARIAWQQR